MASRIAYKRIWNELHNKLREEYKELRGSNIVFTPALLSRQRTLEEILGMMNELEDDEKDRVIRSYF